MVRRSLVSVIAAAAALFAASSAAAGTAAQILGDPLDVAPDTLTASGPADVFQLTFAGATLTAPGDGVITKWRFRARSDFTPASTYRLQVLRGSGPYTAVAETSTGVAPAAGGGVTTVAAQLPIAQGDRLALVSTNRLGALAHDASATLAGFDPPLSLGDSRPANATGLPAARLLVQADVEPDADHDGKGDLTQDEVADLEVTGSAPAQVSALTPFQQTYTIRNLGPDASPGVTIEGVDGTAFAGSSACAGGGPTCVVGPMAAGASLTVTASFAEPAVFPPFPGTFRSSVAVKSDTVDPAASNDTASLATVRLPYDGPPLTLTPPIVVLMPCQNVVRGTRDDDALFGTIYGDRLVGSDGKDLLKGGAGDDCLLGGAGADVLDGGAGADRVLGSAGSDRMVGGSGDDVLSGGAGNDTLLGNNGNDTLQPGPGRDHVIAGAGDDAISAVDGIRETIDCGRGRDTVRADRKDRLRFCEKIIRR